MIPHCPMIRTRFLGPTNHRPARVKAWSVGAGDRPGFRVVLDCIDSDDLATNHERAALALADRLGTDGAPVRCSEDGGGYVFAFVREGGGS